METNLHCCACGQPWPCATPGAEHMSLGELRARMKKADEVLRAIARQAHPDACRMEEVKAIRIGADAKSLYLAEDRARNAVRTAALQIAAIAGEEQNPSPEDLYGKWIPQALAALCDSFGPGPGKRFRLFIDDREA